MTTPDSPVRSGNATRQRLLRPALDLCAGGGGIRDLTTPVIARKAGVADGTIYRRFSGKDVLLNEGSRCAWAGARGRLGRHRFG